jgi:hypothetical protein
LQDRLAHRCSTDAELVGEGGDVDATACRQLAADDAVAKDPSDLVGHATG